MTRVLVTGAGGPAGVAVIRSLLARDDIDVFAADMDRGPAVCTSSPQIDDGSCRPP